MVAVEDFERFKISVKVSFRCVFTGTLIRSYKYVFMKGDMVCLLIDKKHFCNL
jgi:hypothetical protein